MTQTELTILVQTYKVGVECSVEALLKGFRSLLNPQDHQGKCSQSIELKSQFQYLIIYHIDQVLEAPQAQQVIDSPLLLDKDLI